MKRHIVHIDEEKCNGCGLCIQACAEGAIKLIDGKAKLISDTYCDGLGACLGKCPVDAITVEEREADPFDETAVEAHLARAAGLGQAAAPVLPSPSPPCGCPGMAALSFGEPSASAATAPAAAPPQAASELRQWPVQLHLVPVTAPYWKDADLLIAADCVAVAYPQFHAELLKGRRLVIACPKLDQTDGYAAKLAAIIREGGVRSVTVAHMEVPCCTGLVRIAQRAVAESGRRVPFSTVTIGIRGEWQ